MPTTNEFRGQLRSLCRRPQARPAPPAQGPVPPPPAPPAPKRRGPCSERPSASAPPRLSLYVNAVTVSCGFRKRSAGIFLLFTKTARAFQTETLW